MKEFATPLSILISGILISTSILLHGQSLPSFPNVQGAKTEQNTQGGTPPETRVIVSVDDDPFIGDKNAKVTIIEFSDFQCPFCRSFFEDTFTKLKNDYIDTGKVKLVYRDYPLPFHPNALSAAEAAECANEQGKFWEFHDTLFGSQSDWVNLSTENVKTKYLNYAANLGLNVNNFSICLNNETYKDEIQKDTADGSKAGVNGTPSFYINGKQIVGAQPYDVFKTAIDAELNK